MMKRTLFAASSLALIAATPTLAGGYEPPVVEVPVVAPIVVADSGFSWAGGYIGANLNYGKGKYKNVGIGAEEMDLPLTMFRPDGVSGAVRAGYDWQIGAAVLGLGAEYNLGKYKKSGNGEWGEAWGEWSEGSIKKSATIFARGGYAFSDNIMAYGLLGYTWGKGEFKSDDPTYNIMSETLKGPTIGLGAEYRFTNSWSGYAEYAYTKFKKVEYDDGEAETRPDLGQIKLGVNYRF